MKYTSIPIHKDIEISKKVLPQLPKSFEKTSLGYLREGTLAQYRGPSRVHVHEYPNRWLLHRDCGDPRSIQGAMVHMLDDAPEIPASIAVGVISGLIVGKLVHETRKNVSENAKTEAILAGSLTAMFAGLLTYVLIKK